MQPHPPQLPTDSVADASTKHWHKPVLWLVLVVALLAAVIAFMLPKKQVESRNAPAPTEYRTQSPAYSNPNLTH
jgi:hypothetical protein